MEETGKGPHGDDEKKGPHGEDEKKGPHGEDEKERLNRKLMELLNEVRVALPGVQVLFAFLLTLPFTSRFGDITSTQRNLFAVALGTSAAATVLLISTSAYHRNRFRRLEREELEEKREMLIRQDHVTSAGLFFMAGAMASALAVVFDMMFGVWAAIGLGVSYGVAAIWFWYAYPRLKRMQHRNDKGSPAR
ncbi:MAG: DUF6328 family protein [Actinomycetota bacterium]